MSERAVILVVDDSEEDILLISRALEKAFFPNRLYAVKSGEEGISYLEGRGPYSNRDKYPLPYLILLNLKMPGMDGFEVLRWIRRQPAFTSMRVVVLTASDQVRDVNEAYQLGANSFMVKPVDFENYMELGKSLETYWLRENSRPATSQETRAQHAPEWQPPRPSPG